MLVDDPWLLMRILYFTPLLEDNSISQTIPDMTFVRSNIMKPDRRITVINGGKVTEHN